MPGARQLTPEKCPSFRSPNYRIHVRARSVHLDNEPLPVTEHQAHARRVLQIRDAVIPIVPGAIVFDLLNGGDKKWGRFAPYRELGYAAAAAASQDFTLGSAGAGFGATTANFKGGLGSASAVTPGGVRVAALAVVNAVGSVTIGDGP